MIRFGEKAAFLLVIVMIAGLLLLDTRDMRSDVALVPLVIGWPLLVLSVLALTAEVFPVMAERVSGRLPSAFRSYFQSSVADAYVSDVSENSGQTAAVYRFAAWLALGVGLTYFIGLLWAVTIAMFVWIKFVVRGSWLVALAMAAGTAAFNYGVFVIGFEYEYFLRPVMQ